jgi:GTP cyclohydrolase I
MKKTAKKEPNQKKIAELVKSLLIELGEDPEREGLKKTPERVAKSLTYLTRGYRQSVKTVVNGAYFTSGTNHMVILKNIELYSMCEHHMLPFYGSCAIGYISKGKVLGVSKLARRLSAPSRSARMRMTITWSTAEANTSRVQFTPSWRYPTLATAASRSRSRR